MCDSNCGMSEEESLAGLRLVINSCLWEPGHNPARLETTKRLLASADDSSIAVP